MRTGPERPGGRVAPLCRRPETGRDGRRGRRDPRRGPLDPSRGSARRRPRSGPHVPPRGGRSDGEHANRHHGVPWRPPCAHAPGRSPATSPRSSSSPSPARSPSSVAPSPAARPRGSPRRAPSTGSSSPRSCSWHRARWPGSSSRGWRGLGFVAVGVVLGLIAVPLVAHGRRQPGPDRPCPGRDRHDLVPAARGARVRDRARGGAPRRRTARRPSLTRDGPGVAGWLPTGVAAHRNDRRLDSDRRSPESPRPSPTFVAHVGATRCHGCDGLPFCMRPDSTASDGSSPTRIATKDTDMDSIEVLAAILIWLLVRRRRAVCACPAAACARSSPPGSR